MRGGILRHGYYSDRALCTTRMRDNRLRWIPVLSVRMATAISGLVVRGSVGPGSGHVRAFCGCCNRRSNKILQADFSAHRSPTMRTSKPDSSECAPRMIMISSRQLSVSCMCGSATRVAAAHGISSFLGRKSDRAICNLQGSVTCRTLSNSAVTLLLSSCVDDEAIPPSSHMADQSAPADSQLKSTLQHQRLPARVYFTSA